MFELDLSKLGVVARETSDSVIVTDANFVIEWSNPATSRMTGYSADELIGRNILEIAEARTLAPDVVAEMIATLHAGRVFASRVWTKRKGGERFLIDFEVIPHRNSRGESTAFIGITRDVTAQTLAERALRESEEHLRDAQTLAGFGSWRFFVNTGELRWSDQLFAAFGRDKSKGPPNLEQLLEYLHPDDRNKLRDHIHNATSRGEPHEVSFQITRDDGGIAFMHARGNVRRDAKGRIVEHYGTTQDVTARMAAEKERLELHSQLAAAQRLESLGQLAGGLAHDFNNLLMGVRMNTSILERVTSPHPELIEAVDNIQDAVTRMAELTNQLLAYAGQGRLATERIDPNGLMTREMESLRALAPANARLEVDIQQDPVRVEIGSDQLRQVLGNIFTNAVDALQNQPGTITIRTRNEMKESGPMSWVLEITDSGVGMAEAVQRRVFEPFFTTKKLGRGLGLSTVHGIIQHSRGKIGIRSAVAEGTTLTIRLPLVGDAPVTPAGDSVQSRELQPLRILLADDEAMVRRSLRRMLELNRATVTHVADGAEAIAALNEADEPFDVALLDILMPHLSGYEVLGEMRRRRLPTKIILMSGFDNSSNVTDPESAPKSADAMLQKPFAWEELKRVLQVLLEPPSMPETHQ